tara:strand:- start:51 stop:422 length:372 start_codon:yes stop_codon:yes gene_type:complete
MPPINIQEKIKNEPNFARTLRSRSFEKLPQEKVDELLGMCGEVMSMRKFNRKIALLATIQYHMKIDESLNSTMVAERMNKIMIPQNAVTANHIGGLMLVMEKWGFIKRYKRNNSAPYEYIRVK